MQERRIIRFRRVRTNPELPIPGYATDGSAGLDLRASLAEPLVLRPGERALVPTGFAVELPEGTEGQVRPRSGLAAREGVTLLNSPGTIDPDYRGEIQVVLVNLGHSPVRLDPGDRVAQLVVSPLVRAQAVEADSLADSGRGAGGFGHTGRE